MFRLKFLVVSFALLLTACGTTTSTPPTLGTDGKPLPRLYRIAPGAEGRIQFRVLDSINSLRQAAGLDRVRMNAQLNAAAATHSRDMSIQNRPWHFGSDGSSPLERVRRVGYSGRLVGEAISETYETEVQTLAAWMEEEGTRRIIMAPEASEMGFAYFQENNGKIWWTLVMGGMGVTPETAPRPLADTTPPARIVAEIAGDAIAQGAGQ